MISGKGSNSNRARRRRRLLLFLLLAATVGLGAWAFWIEPRQQVIERAEIAWRGPALKVALLSDLHIGAPHMNLERLRDIVRRVNAESPDVVMIAGDFVTRGVLGGRLVEPELIARELAGLRAPLGVVAVLGIHDWWYDGPRVMRALEAEGIVVLEDDARRVASADGPLWLAGVADEWTRGADWQAMLSKVGGDAPVLALTHNPTRFPPCRRASTC